MNENKSESRRRFLTGSAALAGATVLGANIKPAVAQEPGYVIDVPEVTSMEIDGTRDRFPIRRVFWSWP